MDYKKYLYYKQIIAKNYNKNNEKFTFEDFKRLVENPNEKELIKKTYFFAIDYLAFRFANNELQGNFKDALQNAYLFVIDTNKNLISDENASLSKNFELYKKEIVKTFLNNFDKMQEHDKEANIYLNFENVVNADDVEEEIPSAEEEGFDKILTELDVNNARKSVPYDEQHVIERRFGFDGWSPRSVKKVAKECNVTEEYASKLTFLTDILKNDYGMIKN